MCVDESPPPTRFSSAATFQSFRGSRSACGGYPTVADKPVLIKSAASVLK